MQTNCLWILAMMLSSRDVQEDGVGGREGKPSGQNADPSTVLQPCHCSDVTPTTHVCKRAGSLEAKPAPGKRFLLSVPPPVTKISLDLACSHVTHFLP